MLKAGTLVSSVGFVAAILYQIFARLFLATAPSWTEEAARLCFVIAVGCAAGLALRNRSYVHFDFLLNRLPGPQGRGVRVLIDALTVLLFALFTTQALRFTMMGWAERSPSMKFPMAVAFVSMFILGASLLIVAVDRLLGHFRRPTPTDR